MSVCLSKGLGSPVGSVMLVADATRLDEAREIRHQLGGAMRQAGIIAAGGLYALRHHIERLADDHARARRLAEGLADVAPGLVDPAEVETNMVVLDLAAIGTDADTVSAACLGDGVMTSQVGPQRLRLVTHLDIDDDGIDRAVEVIRKALT
jgi:threonine aldolase